MFAILNLASPRRLLLALVALAPLVLLPATALADDDDDRGASNYAYVLNQRDGSVRTSFRVDVNFIRRSTPLAENWACSSNGGLDACWPLCDNIGGSGGLPCVEGTARDGANRDAAAIAFQLNLVSPNYRGEQIQPLNVAIAKNENCDTCKSYAKAVQATFVYNFRDDDDDYIEDRIERIEWQLDRIERQVRSGRVDVATQLPGLVQPVVDDFCDLARDLGGDCIIAIPTVIE